MINTTQAAAALGITPRRVLALIQSGRLPAQKVGRAWIIKKSDLKLVSSKGASQGASFFVIDYLRARLLRRKMPFLKNPLGALLT